MNQNYTLQDLDAPITIEPPKTANAAVIWLHGLGADGHDFVGLLPELGLGEEHSIRFIFPHAPVQPVTVNGGMVMRSWYDIYSMEIAEKMDLHSIQLSSLVVNELIEQQIQQGINPESILLAGFSQGGLVVLNTCLQSKHPLAGVMALSTYYPEACMQEIDDESLNSQIPIFMAHGTHDPVIPFSVAEKSLSRLQAKGCQVEWQSYPMEHQVCMPEIEKIAAWIKAKLIK